MKSGAFRGLGWGAGAFRGFATWVTAVLSLAFGGMVLRGGGEVVVDVSTQPTGVARFWAAEAEPAGADSVIWLVVDGNRDGLAFAEADLGGISDALAALRSGEGDDRIVFEDRGDGALLGDQPGRYLRTGIRFALDGEALLHLVLWRDGNGDGRGGGSGDFFGVVELGEVWSGLYDLGNHEFGIVEPVRADRELVGVLPLSGLETGQGDLLGAAGSGGGTAEGSPGGSGLRARVELRHGPGMIRLVATESLADGAGRVVVERSDDLRMWTRDGLEAVVLREGGGERVTSWSLPTDGGAGFLRYVVEP